MERQTTDAPIQKSLVSLPSCGIEVAIHPDDDVTPADDKSPIIVAGVAMLSGRAVNVSDADKRSSDLTVK